MIYRQTFAVKGSGEFPVDMLRYDACYPASQDDSVKLSRRLERRTVCLERRIANRGPVPTVDRWSSFGWCVLADTIAVTKF